MSSRSKENSKCPTCGVIRLMDGEEELTGEEESGELEARESVTVEDE